MLLHSESLTFSSSLASHFFAPPDAFPPPVVLLLQDSKVELLYCSCLCLIKDYSSSGAQWCSERMYKHLH